MARAKREWYPGAMYHVMSRGNRRLVLYQDEEDYITFLEYVNRAKELYPFILHSICLMTNHFHMIIETIDDELWKIMSKILHSYAMYFNHKYDYTGHLFEKRYTACIIKDERYFSEVSRYIHLNPVKAKMVDDAIDYKYTSYYLFVNDGSCVRSGKVYDEINKLIKTDKLLCLFGNNRELYKAFVEEKKAHLEHESVIQKDIKEDDMWLPI